MRYKCFDDIFLIFIFPFFYIILVDFLKLFNQFIKLINHSFLLKIFLGVIAIGGNSGTFILAFLMKGNISEKYNSSLRSYAKMKGNADIENIRE